MKVQPDTVSVKPWYPEPQVTQAPVPQPQTTILSTISGK